MNNGARRGAEIEEMARRFLTDRGMRTVERNYRGRRGEIDLIMLDGDDLVFVEVRYRSGDAYGSAAESVTPGKQKKIIKTASGFLQARKQWANHPCRFDVMAITGRGRIQWIRDAFQPAF